MLTLSSIDSSSYIQYSIFYSISCPVCNIFNEAKLWTNESVSDQHLLTILLLCGKQNETDLKFFETLAKDHSTGNLQLKWVEFIPHQWPPDIRCPYHLLRPLPTFSKWLNNLFYKEYRIRFFYYIVIQENPTPFSHLFPLSNVSAQAEVDWGPRERCELFIRLWLLAHFCSEVDGRREDHLKGGEDSPAFGHLCTVSKTELLGSGAASASVCIPHHIPEWQLASIWKGGLLVGQNS